MGVSWCIEIICWYVYNYTNGCNRALGLRYYILPFSGLIKSYIWFIKRRMNVFFSLILLSVCSSSPLPPSSPSSPSFPTTLAHSLSLSVYPSISSLLYLSLPSFFPFLLSLPSSLPPWPPALLHPLPSRPSSLLFAPSHIRCCTISVRLKDLLFVCSSLVVLLLWLCFCLFVGSAPHDQAQDRGHKTAGARTSAITITTTTWHWSHVIVEVIWYSEGLRDAGGLTMSEDGTVYRS